MKKIRHLLKKTTRLLYGLIVFPFQTIWLGIQQGKFLSSIKLVLKAFFQGFSYTTSLLKKNIDSLSHSDAGNLFGFDDPKQIKRSTEMVLGFHTLLPVDSFYTYTLFMRVDNFEPFLLKESLQSLLSQTAPVFEVILLFKQQPSRSCLDLLAPFKVRWFVEGEDVIKQMKGNIIVFFEECGVMRPDLLFRIEQMFRFFSEREKKVVYTECVEAPFSEKRFHFPYLFYTDVPGCIAIPKGLVEAVSLTPEETFYDLLLKLDLVGADFHKTATPLYVRRVLPKTARDKESLERYLEAKKLNWNVEEGVIKGTFRVLPPRRQQAIHVIIPFKDQKEMTLKAVASLQKQKGVQLKITAIDNRSSDQSIQQELRKQGVEVLSIDEPFNFSRLNNLAVKQTQIGVKSPLVFFMNNDVELCQEDHLEEMGSWIDQPLIGIVGCRLNYPNGLLQHGGIEIDRKEPAYMTFWRHVEHQRQECDLIKSQLLRVTDAVTGAAILMKKELFLQVGGFDEIWFPNSCSDTNLVQKINRLGYVSFYTPYASAVHHESISRINGGFAEEYSNLSLVEKYHEKFVQKHFERSDL